MDKKAILNSIIEELEKQCLELQKDFDADRRAAAEAPSPMQSHSDTTRFQMNVSADRTRELLDKKKRSIVVLKDCLVSLPKNCRSVKIGTLVHTKDSDGKEVLYLFLPEGGGLKTMQDKQNITVITPRSPIGAILLEKTKGETVEFKIPIEQNAIRKITITEIE